jgi:Protein of unknown function (DUF4231)
MVPSDAGAGPASYITERLEQYQHWYDRKAALSKRRYLWMRGFAVVGGAVVPALVNISFSGRDALTTVLSLLVVISVSLESVLHYREQWRNYRSTEQALGHERMFFETGVGPYKGLDSDAAFKLLVERVEALIAAENAATLNTMAVAVEATAPRSEGAARSPE